MFHGHGGHRNFLKHFDVVATGLDGGRLYKVFLDGASANELYQEIIITRQVELLYMLIDRDTQLVHFSWCSENRSREKSLED